MNGYFYVFFTIYIIYFFRKLTVSFKSSAAHAVIYMRCKAAIIIDMNCGMRIRDCIWRDISNQN